MKEADGVPVAIIGAEAVRADEFRQAVGLVGRGRLAAAAHFREAHLEPSPRKLPRCLASGEAAADDLDVVCHCEGHLVACVAACNAAAIARCASAYRGE